MFYENDTTSFTLWLRGKRCTADSVSLADNKWTWVMVYWETTSYGQNHGSRKYVYLDTTKYSMVSLSYNLTH